MPLMYPIIISSHATNPTLDFHSNSGPFCLPCNEYIMREFDAIRFYEAKYAWYYGSWVGICIGVARR